MKGTAEGAGTVQLQKYPMPTIALQDMELICMASRIMGATIHVSSILAPNRVAANRLSFTALSLKLL